MVSSFTFMWSACLWGFDQYQLDQYVPPCNHTAAINKQKHQPTLENMEIPHYKQTKNWNLNEKIVALNCLVILQVAGKNPWSNLPTLFFAQSELQHPGAAMWQQRCGQTHAMQPVKMIFYNCCIFCCSQFTYLESEIIPYLENFTCRLETSVDEMFLLLLEMYNLNSKRICETKIIIYDQEKSKNIFNSSWYLFFI